MGLRGTCYTEVSGFWIGLKPEPKPIFSIYRIKSIWFNRVGSVHRRSVLNCWTWPFLTRSKTRTLNISSQIIHRTAEISRIPTIAYRPLSFVARVQIEAEIWGRTQGEREESAERRRRRGDGIGLGDNGEQGAMLRLLDRLQRVHVPLPGAQRLRPRPRGLLRVPPSRQRGHPIPTLKFHSLPLVFLLL